MFLQPQNAHPPRRPRTTERETAMTRFLKFFGIVLWAISFLASPSLAVAQRPQPLADADRAVIIDQISDALLETYVFPEDAEIMAQRLAKQLESGAYDDATDVAVFCRLLTKDLHSVRPDLHLHADPAPPPPPEPTEEQMASEEKRMLEKLRRLNYGFRKLEMLDGNVGYLRFDAFIEASLGGATADSAMAFLADADAIIFDLRNNGGGSPTMIQLISSYLFEEPTHLNSFYVRKSDTMREFWTESEIQGKRRPEVPVFVLTSGRTFSAAEEFTYNLKHLGRATIVGEVTRGGAHPVMRFSVEGYPIAVSIPFGRAVNPITGTNWEGIGVEPHIEVAAEQALDNAHIKALEMIEDVTEDPLRKQELELARTRVEVRIDPIEFDEAQMQAYAGVYGTHSVSVMDGHLVLLMGGSTEFPMIPIGDDRFLIDAIEEVLVRFERDEAGAVIAANSFHDGMKERYPRKQE
jgi:hypothetical protein